MDDLNRAPGESDRKPVRERIRRAVAEGRISSVDGDIRLTNVSSAQSLTELSLIARDLDQLDAAKADAERFAAPATVGVAPQQSIPTPAPAPSSGRLVPLLILGLVFSLVVAGAIALFVVGSNSGKDEIGDLPPTSQNQVAPESPGSPDPGDGVSPEPAAVPFERSATGIKALLAQYKKKFGTTKATELSMYDNYAIVRVPVPGKNRDSGWSYRDGEWSEFGGVRATMTGTGILDLARLDIDALVRNMNTAKRKLNVEDASISHVSLDFRSQFDDVPNVRIYASNEFGESGYLATTLNGDVLRSYPYSR